MVHPVIVMNMGVAGLGIARSLGRLGIPIVGMDYNIDAIGFHSKFCEQRIITLDPVKNPEKCLHDLLEFRKQIDGDAILFPASDRYVIFMSRYFEVLSKEFIFNIPNRSILGKIVDKKEQHNLAKKLNIPLPYSLFPENLKEMESEYENINYPVFVKGRSSYEWVEIFNSKGILVHNKEELESVLKEAFNYNCPPVVQEVILGPDKNHFEVCAYYDKNSQLKCIFSTEKSRQFPIEFGVGSFMTSYYHSELIDLSKKFFDGINYTGVGEIEFKYDERYNEFKFIELNPRYWQQNNQATYAGINFPLINYYDCLGEAIKEQKSFLDNIIWIDFIQDFRSFIKNLKKKNITLREWISSVSRIKCHSYFASDDLRPTIYHFKSVLHKAKNQIKNFILGEKHQN